jgi:hypothetical protein
MFAAMFPLFGPASALASSHLEDAELILSSVQQSGIPVGDVPSGYACSAPCSLPVSPSKFGISPQTDSSLAISSTAMGSKSGSEADMQAKNDSVDDKSELRIIGKGKTV